MAMEKLLRFFLVLFAITASTACTQEINWNGIYIYEADYGKNYAETSMIVTYTLTLSETSCNLEEAGYQTWNIIICDAKTDKNSIKINFKSYENEQTVNNYNNKIYSVDDTLFSLTINEGKVVTKWEKYSPDESFGKIGKMFTKIE